MESPIADTIVVEKPELERFVIALLKKVKVSDDDAATVAEALVWADLRGRHPQGVLRLPTFIERVRKGVILSPARMQLTNVAQAAALLDAGDAFGHVAGKAGMQKAIELARSGGIGIVAVRRSNLNGALSYFCALATEAGCIGLTCTNGFAKVAPFGGVRPVFGTNPIAFGAPTSSGIPILVDLSTSAIAGSSTRSLNAHGKHLPDGVALDKKGMPTTNPKDLTEGTLLPAAGAKGFGLALMVEILSAILSGAAMSKEVGSVFKADKPANVGHVFLAIDVEKFQPLNEFVTRIETLCSWARESAPEGGRVRIPGEIRGEFGSQYSRDGIPLPNEAVVSLTKLAHEFEVECPWQMNESMTIT